jgi:hypothetical protein
VCLLYARRFIHRKPVNRIPSKKEFECYLMMLHPTPQPTDMYGKGSAPQPDYRRTQLSKLKTPPHRFSLVLAVKTILSAELVLRWLIPTVRSFCASPKNQG